MQEEKVMPMQRKDLALDLPFRRSIEPFGLVRNLLKWDPSRPDEGEEAADSIFSPPLDIKESNDNYVFLVDLPGISQENVEIDLAANKLTISGEREVESLGETENYYAMERAFGPFRRTFNLPEGVDLENARAAIHNGVLTVLVPKARGQQGRKVPVEGH
jgi:HSP20 family protein